MYLAIPVQYSCQGIFLILERAVSNWQGGLSGVAAFLLLWAMVFFTAFLAAFGNDTPEARLILQGVAVFVFVANPLWGVPLSYLAGCCLFLQSAAGTR